MARDRATRKAAVVDGEHTTTRRESTYLIRRRIEASEAAQVVWVELGAINASNPRKALQAFAKLNAEELAELGVTITLEAVSDRYRFEDSATPTRQLSIKWGSA